MAYSIHEQTIGHLFVYFVKPSVFRKRLCSFSFQRMPNAPYADDDEGNAEQLSHVEEHARLPCFLYIFRIFDEETEGENLCQTETEEETRTHFEGRAFFLSPEIEPQADKEETGIGDGFVELSWMPRKLVNTLKDECPGNVGHFANDFAVHQVA